MAATIDTPRTAKILRFRARCKGVSETDEQRRLPTISSDEIDSIFATAQARKTALRRAV